MVWLTVCYFTASWQGGGGEGRGGVGHMLPIQLQYLGQVASREGGCVPTPWLIREKLLPADLLAVTLISLSCSLGIWSRSCLD
jgi:hypothetical protein